MSEKQKSVLRLLLGFIAATLCIALAIYLRLPVAELLIVVLFALGVALLSFLVVGTITGSATIFELNIKTVSAGFLVFLIVLGVYLRYDERLFKVNQYKQELVEIARPGNIAIWEKPADQFKWFNAPFAFAGSSHFTTKLTWFKDPSFHLYLLLFDVPDQTRHHRNFTDKLARMRAFLSRLDSHVINLKSRVDIRVYMGTNIPSTSFFTTGHGTDEKPYSIMYMSKYDRPNECLVSTSMAFQKMLEAEFSNFWEHDNCFRLSIDRLLEDSLLATDGPNPFFDEQEQEGLAHQQVPTEKEKQVPNRQKMNQPIVQTLSRNP